MKKHSRKNWNDLSTAITEKIATRYEAACLFAARRARISSSTDSEFENRFHTMRAGIWAGLAQEIRDLGCPEHKIPDEISRIVNFAARRRALEGLPAKGNA